ncbi:MAG: lactonase family protein [Bacteroidales bacterium]|nr:lactonase family protein [Bacteroidales bacterium]
MRKTLQYSKPLILIISAAIIMNACRPRTADNYGDSGTAAGELAGFLFYVGTYTGSESRGIYKSLLGEDGSLRLSGLATQTENPSFLALSPCGDFLLAVNENSPAGTVESFRIKDDSLVLVSRQSSGGEHPCYVSINEAGYVLTANYSSGNVGLLKMNKGGRLGELLDIQQHTGKGSGDRQEGPHAHSVYFEPGTSMVISSDLGTNEIWFSVLDTVQGRLLPANQQNLMMEPGAGPRHMAFHPNGSYIYVINELNSTVTLVKKNKSGEYEKGLSFTTLPAGYEGPNYCADIHIAADGRFVYASNRGHNSIAIFKVEPETGILTPSGHCSSSGEWPRNFVLSPDENFLLVANQNSDNIVSFKRDINSGLCEPVDTISIPDPVFILFGKKL